MAARASSSLAFFLLSSLFFFGPTALPSSGEFCSSHSTLSRRLAPHLARIAKKMLPPMRIPADKSDSSLHRGEKARRKNSNQRDILAFSREPVIEVIIIVLINSRPLPDSSTFGALLSPFKQLTVYYRPGEVVRNKAGTLDGKLRRLFGMSVLVKASLQHTQYTSGKEIV